MARPFSREKWLMEKLTGDPKPDVVNRLRRKPRGQQPHQEPQEFFGKGSPPKQAWGSI